jgi:hypothetical protein
MPTSEILFDPNLDERALDKEVDQVNDQLAGVGEDVPVNFDPEEMEMDGLMPAGGRGGGGGFGGAAAGAGLASKIPKPVAGVTAAAAMPIAISGAVGVGMLSAMQGASARMQTSASILGQAWNNIWRPIGDKVDQLFIRPVALDILQATQDYADLFRSADWLTDPIMRAFGSALKGDTFGVASNLHDAFENAADRINWDAIIPSFPSWPDIKGLWPGWPDVGVEWPGWPDIGEMWPGWPDLGMPEWPSSQDILSLFPSISVGSLRDAILGDGDAGGGVETGGGGGGGRPREGFVPGGSGGGGGDDEIDWGDPSDVLSRLPITGPSMQSGGRVTGSGVATVHRGELVADPDRLVSELASAVSQASGGGRRRMDTSGMEREIQNLRRDVQRLASALDVTVEVGGETIARASAQGKKDGIADSNPKI